MGYFSNGTEAISFQEEWCRQCVHWGADDHSKATETKGCPVFDAHFLYQEGASEETQGVLDLLITRTTQETADGIGVPVNKCQMYREAS